MLILTGLVFACIGTASGALLLLRPLGLWSLPVGPAVWVLYPLLSLLGFLFVALPTGVSTARVLCRVFGTTNAVLAAAAAIGLFLTKTGLVPAQVATFSLWYVLLIGLLAAATALTVNTARPVQE